MMYPFSEFKTEVPSSWADPYGGVGAVGVMPDTMQTHFNNRTPDPSDSYSYPHHNSNGYYQNQFTADQTSLNFYQQQQQQQQQLLQQQQSYYNSEAYYQTNGGAHFSNQRQSPEYYHNIPPQQQQQQQQLQQQQQAYDYNTYQNVSGGGQQWNQSDYASNVQMRLQQEQQTFLKTELSPSYCSVVKTENFESAQQSNLENGVCVENGSSSTGSSSNFYFDNFSDSPNCELSPGEGLSPGRLPSMSQFGFAAETSYKMEQQQQQQQQCKSNFGFQNEQKPVKYENASHMAGRITDHMPQKKKSKASAKRTLNRFNGMSEEEVAKQGLPDYLREGLDIVFIGINPSMFAAYTGKYYDGPGNHFWQALHLSGLLPQLMSPEDDHKLLERGIGFTNLVARTTRGLSDLSKDEMVEGAKILREKLMKFRPKIAVFNGKAIYEVYSGQKKFMFGKQPDPIVYNLTGEQTWLWVMPSSSARCAQLPKAIDKVPFFEALRKFRDYLSGKLPKLDMQEIMFANVTLRNAPRKLKTEFEQQSHALVFKQNLDSDRFIDYTRLEPWTDGRLAKVPPSVDAVIESVIQKYGRSPIHDLDDLDEDDDDDDDIDEDDFKDEDSNGICEMNFKDDVLT